MNPMSNPEQELRTAKRKRNFWIALLVLFVLFMLGSMNLGSKPKAGTAECTRRLNNVHTVEDLHKACDY